MTFIYEFDPYPVKMYPRIYEFTKILKLKIFLCIFDVLLSCGYCVTCLQIIIASIMCGYSKEDWTELAQMAEVSSVGNPGFKSW